MKVLLWIYGILVVAIFGKTAVNNSFNNDMPVLCFFVIMGVIIYFGYNQYSKIPKPPKEFNSKERQWWYSGGWKQYQAQIEAEQEYNRQIGEAIEYKKSFDHMDGHDFEYYCAELLRRNGFSDVEVTRGSGDQGVDVLAYRNGKKYAIQCKNYSSALSNKPVQEVNAGKVFYGCDIGVVMTNSTFTSGAKSLAAATGVLLWDRRKIEEFLEGNSDIMFSKMYDRTKLTTKAPATRSSIENTTISSQQDPVINKVSDKNVGLVTENFDGIEIVLDSSSAARNGISIENLGLDTDEDDTDNITLLFDAIALKQGYPADVTIFCNVYAGSRKLLTDDTLIYRESFYRESLSVYFEKKNILNTATKIEIYCTQE